MLFLLSYDFILSVAIVKWVFWLVLTQYTNLHEQQQQL